MEFQIARSILSGALNTVSKAISSTAPIPSLSGVKIDVFDDRIELVGSDSEISILKVLYVKDEENKLEIDEIGSIVLDARYILEIVKRMDSSLVKIELVDGTLTKITGSNAEFKINGIRPSDYLTIDFAVTTPRNKMSVSTFEKIVRQTTFACSDKETKPALMGVNFKASGNTLVCNATNSFRLATKKIALESELNFDITIPARTLLSVSSLLQENLEFEMAIDQTKVSFIFDDTIVRGRLIDDIYPDVSRLIPPAFSQTLEINRRDLLDAVDRTSFIKSEGKNVIKMKIDSDHLDISSSSQEIGSSHETVDVISFKGDMITISCSGKYLFDALRTIDSDIVILSFSGELRPIVINGKDDESLIQLVSPIRS